MNLAVGIDDGYAQTKVVLPDGRSIVIPSHGRSGKPRVTGVMGSEKKIGCYETEGREYAVGISDPEPTRFSGYAYSPLNRSIVHHALRQLGLDQSRIDVASCLPVSDFYLLSGEKQDSVIEKKRASLLKPVITSSGEVITIAYHTVVPEALAAWYDLAIDDQSGQPVLDRNLMASPVAVVDIGGRTTDVVVVVNQAIVHDSSGSANIGVMDLLDQLAERICIDTGLDRVSQSTVRQGLESGAVDLFGSRIDVSTAIAECKERVLSQIEDQCRRKLGQAAELHQVLFVGGGAALFRNDLTGWFRNGVLPADPIFANARGLLKFLRYVCERPKNPTVITADQ